MKKYKKRIIVILSFIGIILILITYKYINKKYNIGIPCVIHEITGLYCPGCGITRAIFYLLDLKPIEAIKSNILMFILSPFIIIYLINYIKIYLQNKNEDPSKIFPKKLWYTLLVITIIFGIIRNINYFSWLQPI